MVCQKRLKKLFSITFEVLLMRVRDTKVFFYLNNVQQSFGVKEIYRLSLFLENNIESATGHSNLPAGLNQDFWLKSSYRTTKLRKFIMVAI